MRGGPTIQFPTEAEEQALKAKFFAELKQVAQARKAAVAVARPALARLVLACSCKTGQGYKLRALLYSLWNGQPVSLADTLGLDWVLKEDFGAVLLAFGANEFFYDDLERSFKDQGLFDWFTEAHNPTKEFAA